MSRYHFSDNNPMDYFLVKNELINRLVITSRPITWIWGGSGTGKSVLASMLYTKIHGNKFWLDINEDDADVVRFLRRLINELEKNSSNEKSQALTNSFIGQGQTDKLFVDRCGKLLDLIDQPLSIFLDNAQWVHAFLPDLCSLLAKQKKPNIKIFITSQVCPDNDFTSLIVSDDIEEVPPSLLLFTLNETLTLFKKHSLDVNENVVQIYQKNRGLPAAITNSLLTIKNGSSDTGILDETSDFGALTSIELNLLTELSLYASISRAVLDYLGEEHNAYHHLQKMVEQRLFVDSETLSEGEIFHIHPILKVTLTENQSKLPNKVVLHAAKWEEQAGNIASALRLYAKSDEYDAFTRLFLTHVKQWYATGKSKVIDESLKQVSDIEKNKRPWLWVWESVLRLSVLPDEARSLAEQAYKCFKKSADIKGMYVSIAQVILTYLVKLSDFSEIKYWLHELSRFDTDEAFELIDDASLRSTVCYPVWFCMFIVMPEHESLQKWEKRTLCQLVEETDVISKLKILLLLQKAYLYRGDNYKIHPLESLVHIGNDKSFSPYDSLSYNLVKIHESWCHGDFSEIKSIYSNSISLAHAHNMQASLPHTSLQVAIAFILDGEYAEAKREIYQLLDDIPGQKTALLHHLYSIEAWRQSLQHEYAQAVSTANLCNKISNKSGCVAYIGFSLITQAYANALAGEYEQARKKLIDFDMSSAYEQYQIFYFHQSLLSCFLEFKRNNRSAAIEHATKAVDFSINKNLIYYIWSVPEILALNVSLALENGSNREHCYKLIDTLNLLPPDSAKSEKSWCWPVVIKTLGGFQTNIAQLNKPGKSRRIQLQIIYLAITYSDTGVPLEVLYDVLWPNEDIISARHKLDNSIYRVRQILGKENIKIVNNNVQLDTGNVWVDVIYLFELLRKCKKALQYESDVNEIKYMVEEVLHLYRGQYLEGVADASDKIVNLRVYIRSSVVDVLESTDNFMRKKGGNESADFIYSHLATLVRPIDGSDADVI
ncbi:hypothetical protein MNBD_GAMMA05-943 [hydrothermal vent metagenome]|uniref:Uncharacterized protein n=1 Tax=hydrothermal vent metagenome TaxID=652676 RepID=A0A3B0W589_9ZZZZ